MVFYQCFRCGYSSNDKSKIRLHINRKNTCTIKLNDIKLDVCKNAILQGLSYEDYLKKSVDFCKSTENHISPTNKPQNNTINHNSPTKKVITNVNIVIKHIQG